MSAKPSPTGPKRDNREARLKAALRANLRRRKGLEKPKGGESD